jgi:hypothetical protein
MARVHADATLRPRGHKPERDFFNKKIMFLVVGCWKKEEKNVQFSVFNPQDPQDP